MFLRHPWRIINSLNSRGIATFIPDEWVIRMQYKDLTGMKLNLKEPRTFNEKLQWLKLHDHNPLYTTMVDKYEAKKYVAGIIGEEYIIPTLGVWDRFDDIDFDSLPEQFVLKCTHNSGGIAIVRDKNKFEYDKEKAKFEYCLRNNYFWGGREWPYKNVRPRIIAEKLINSLDEFKFIEYKVFCSYGEPKLILVCKGEAHSSNRTNSFYDIDFHPIPVDTVYPRSQEIDYIPENIEELLHIARVLSNRIPFIRVDTYIIKNQIYFGELTLYHNSGICPFNPAEYDLEFGRIIDIDRFMNEHNLKV